MKKMKRILLIILAIAVFGIITFPARFHVLKGMGRFLVVQDALKKADVLVVLSGQNERVEEAARLYKQGWAKYVIMTGKVSAAGMKRTAVRLGVPAENIIIESQATSTYEHPGFVKPIMEEHGFTSAIVVSSPYHMRRVAMLFDRAFKRAGIKTIYYPVQDSWWFDADSWWTRAVSRRAVKLEYAKMAVNVWGNGFSRFMEKLIGR